MAAQRSAQTGDAAVGGKQASGEGEGAEERGKLCARVIVATCSLSSGLHLQGCSSDSTGAGKDRQRETEREGVEGRERCHQ